MPSVPAVSVVCATYGRPASVRRLLDALAQQTLQVPFEVIISDDGSGDEAVAEVRSAIASCPLEVVLQAHPQNRGPGAARNDGWRAARAPVIAFTDDDCQPMPNWLERGMQLMEAGDLVVIGRVLPDPAQQDGVGPWSRTLNVRSAKHFQTANAFYARADLAEVGGFDEGFVLAGGEDTDLGMRVLALGRTSTFAEEAVVLHDVRAGTVWKLAKERATKWVDLPLVIRKHPQLRQETLYKKWFWKRSHPAVICALGGLVLLPFGATSPVIAGSSALLLLPWLLDRGLLHPPATGFKWRVQLMPGTFLVDAAEVVSMIRGSIRHRTLVL